ncbi:MAG: hypothetical protein DIZ80_06510 [endosymbiont of Galathealinum brachiosum]|uniref:Uncharacterized protein n=1 Tax=endosymbiont of Galathealinum brachiosum TaxID=2200906 RepID=A0A370DHZ7_9GAMM|nr:MAG: hypothetical protein DIZ80_06510 [endosymbiont of Galathealinum brachiosum]
MKIFFTRLFFILIFQSLISVSFARETGYEVELIIFEDAKARYLQSEDWSYNDMLHNKKESEEKAVDKDPEYKQLSWDDSKLSANVARLRNNHNYKILVTKRWKQTGLDRKHAFNIPIDSNINNSTSIELEKTDTSFSTDNIEPYVTGNVKLIMSRYLHFNVNLKYIMPHDNNGEIESMLLPVVDERRMRSREIHYIDHPLVGVVVLATPYEIKSTEENTKTTKYKTM